MGQTEKLAEDKWPDLNSSANHHISTLYGTVQHVSKLTRIASVNKQLNSLSITSGQESTQIATSVTFPVSILPYEPNPTFCGRQEELKRIAAFLGPKEDPSFKTYSIYGRRGVGKTSLALQFAHSCAGDATYDAVFWIQCETSVSIRQSFAKIAKVLEIPGAEYDNHHEENLIAIKTWLKLTSRTWLLVFDNVESEKVLRPYWPKGVSGAVLITSRSYFNFIRDVCRQGQTVKPLDLRQSWELLLDLLGDHWKELSIKSQLPDSEIVAAKSMLQQLEGLPLTIEQTATLVKDETIGGRTIARTYEAFKDRIRALPERLSMPRSASEKSLDALWDITFKALSRNARSLIGVLAWLSPDGIQIQLFQPKDSTILNATLAFCKPGSSQLLHGGVTISPGLDKAICELQEKKLIKYNKQMMSIHRVVQEAVNFQSVEDLQEAFDAAAKLVANQFPKRLIIGTMYLFELGDYDTCEQIIDTALMACKDRKSLLYSRLRGTQGCLFFDLTLLSKCREAWEETLQIREEILPHDDPYVAGMLSNLGNLELAVGNVGAALKYYDRALQVWINSNEESVQSLAKTYLSMGRAYMYQGNLAEALKYTDSAEALVARTLGMGFRFMANVHYAYGDIHLRRNDLDSAIKSYQACLNIGLTNMPLHPIIAATWYSLACVNLALGNDDAARSNLDKAEAISRLGSPARDDGPIARILWKRATILESDSSGKHAEEATDLKAKAAEIKQRLMASGEGGMIPHYEDQGNSKDKENREEDSYDALVSLFYR
ncbi:P-loop containing nucleoside triphosphate hydrolase protein [Leptodontidium sp. 2 PMI_412]|nr:P-loop containing nucleoside triphosphate hydrolase protein [Leptodontidium sp. 2 PMI_412]